VAAREKNFLLEVMSRYHESGYLGRKEKRERLGTESPREQAASQQTLCRHAAQLEMGSNVFKHQSLEVQADVFYTRLSEGSCTTERAVLCKDIQPSSSTVCQPKALSMLLIWLISRNSG